MIEPKIFYRKLDLLLAKLGRQKSGKPFFFAVAKELENTFGADLKISNGRVYEEGDDGFKLIYPEVILTKQFTKKLDFENPAVEGLIISKTYIFDDPSFSIDARISNQPEYAIPAAFTVNSPEQRYIFVFELKSGWVREEVEFCLNAVRRAVNYRLFSEAVKSEMEQAARIQQSLLPSAMPDIHGFDIAAKSRPAEMVGGDMYDFYEFEDGNFGVAVGDASGHGLPAALLVRDVVTGLRMGLERHFRMDYTLKKLNNVIYRGGYSTSFISLFYCEIEKNGVVFYVNAGHPAPFIIHTDGSYSNLEATGLIFGAFKHIDLQRKYAEMEHGSILVLYSDGMFERMNSRGEEFGIEKLKEIISARKNETASQMVDAVFQELEKYGVSTEWEDDATLVVLKRL